MSTESRLVERLRANGRAIPIVAMICRQTGDAVLELVAEWKRRAIASGSDPDQTVDVALCADMLRDLVHTKCAGRMIAAGVVAPVLEEIWFGEGAPSGRVTVESIWTDLARVLVKEVSLEVFSAWSSALSSFQHGTPARLLYVRADENGFCSSATVAALSILSVAVQLDRNV